MEPHSVDNEETAQDTFQPYHPQSFDRAEPAAGEAAPPLPAAARGADFEQRFSEEAQHRPQFEDAAQAAGGEGPDFASLKFQRENTLLTNAESYAASIREEAQLYVRQLRSEVESLNAEAEQRYAEAERIKAEAVAEAERLTTEAQTAMDDVRQQAHQEGYDAGYEEGLQRRYEEAAPQMERLEEILTELGQFRRRVAYYTEHDGVQLALLIAKKVLQTELKTNKQAIGRLVANTLAQLQGKGTFRLWVSAEDHQFMVGARKSLERFLDEEQSLTLRARPDLAPGNVVIETDREAIDLTFESQFYHLEQQLQQTLGERETVLTRPQGQGAGPQRPPPAAQPQPGDVEQSAEEAGDGA